MRWRCFIGLHPWSLQTRGILINGFMEAVRTRRCTRCGISEREVFDAETGSARWIAAPGFDAEVKN